MKIIIKYTVICFIITVISISIYSRVTEITYENAIVKEETKDYTVFAKPDGTVITKTKISEKAVFADGTVIEFNHETGIKEALYKDGSKLIVDYPKGLRTSITADGVKQVFDYNGKTLYGDEIAEIRRKVQTDPVLVEFIFNPLNSDDLPDEITMKVFNKVFDVLYQKTATAKYENKNPLIIEMGYCHFGNYGKCYKTVNKIRVSFMQKGKVLKTFEGSSLLLKDDVKLKEFTDQIAEYFKGI